jgi:tetratricopeptide (TPR) repeat protein
MPPRSHPPHPDAPAVAHLGWALRVRREKMPRERDQIADLLGYSADVVKHIENGTYRAKVDHFIAEWAKAFGLDDELRALWERVHQAQQQHDHEQPAQSRPSTQQAPIKGQVIAPGPLAAEAELFDTMELVHLAGASDISPGTIEILEEAVDLLCRAYPSTPAAVLRDRAKQRLAYVLRLFNGRLTLRQHRELLVHAGWLAALLGCVHYDLGEREQAEAARQCAYQFAKEAGHGELMGWAYEMTAWFALVEGRYEDVLDAARQGQRVAGTSNALVQLILQEAKGYARLGDAKQARITFERGRVVLERLPIPSNPAHHFVFDRTKWIFYGATIHTWLSDDDRAEEFAQEILDQHTRPDGTTNAPMRVADVRIDLAIVHARRGDLDAAVDQGLAALSFERKTLPSIVARGTELERIFQDRYRNERLTADFHERLMLARRSLTRPELPPPADGDQPSNGNGRDV